ncbi:hypothetical protein P7C70_g6013, partial [Phenoliferia sp. Uapishka_3]
MFAYVFIRYFDQDIPILCIPSKRTMASPDWETFTQIRILREFVTGLCRIERGTLVELLDDGSERPLDDPQERWTGSGWARRKFIYIIAKEDWEEVRLCYWKDLAKNVVKPSDTRMNFDKRARRALDRRTFGKCSLTGRWDADDCHLIPATRGNIFAHYISPDDSYIRLGDARNGIKLSNELHKAQESGSLLFLPLPPDSDPSDPSQTPTLTDLYPTNFLLFRSSRLFNEIPALQKIPHEWSFFDDEPCSRWPCLTAELDQAIRLPTRWIWRYKFAVGLIQQYGVPGVEAHMKKMQEPWQTELDMRSDSAETTGSADQSSTDGERTSETEDGECTGETEDVESTSGTEDVFEGEKKVPGGAEVQRGGDTDKTTPGRVLRSGQQNNSGSNRGTMGTGTSQKKNTSLHLRIDQIYNIKVWAKSVPAVAPRAGGYSLRDRKNPNLTDL